MIIVAILLLPLTGRLIHLYYTQGVALGWELLGFQPVRYTLSIICLHPTTNIPSDGFCWVFCTSINEHSAEWFGKVVCVNNGLKAQWLP